jgi:transcriptional regulator
MYVPRYFEQPRLDIVHEAIERIQVATLVTIGTEGPFVSHLPMMLERESGPFGKLVGHLARANPHWKAADGLPALAIFFGPNGYISPNWYPSKRETQKVVPTWDYIAVHARGTLQTFEEPERLRAFVTALTNLHESSSAHPWHIDDAPEPYVESQLKAIVGLELPIDTLIGKWKLSQNRPGDDIDGVIRALREIGDEGSLELAREVERARPAP